VAPTIDWQKSTFSGGAQGNDCVELAAPGGTIHLRESDNPGVVVTTTPEKLGTFIRGVKAGQFDV
jgi:hypothetical protein